VAGDERPAVGELVAARPLHDAREVGGELGLELLAGARELAQGVYVMAPFRTPMNVVDFLPVLDQPAQPPVDTGAFAEASARRTTDAGTP